jgi:hypothetical protein
MVRISSFPRVRKRLITVLLVAICAFLLTPSWKEVGPLYFPFWFAAFLLFVGSQVFWIGQVLNIGVRIIPGQPRRFWLELGAVALYVFFFFAYSFAPLKMLFTGHTIYVADKRFYRTLIDGIFSVWLVGSSLGFLAMMFFWVADRVVCSAISFYRRLRAAPGGAVAPCSNGRRHLLRQLAIAVSAAPFGAAAYGLLCERVNVEITRGRITLSRLPKAFEGFRPSNRLS